MRTFDEIVIDYAMYHRNPFNKWTHIIGIPVLIYSMLIPLCWFRFLGSDAFPASAGSVFLVPVMIYYGKLDRQIALQILPFAVLFLFAADRTAVMPFSTSVSIFLVGFIGGWGIQFIGHAVEGRKPAFLDNVFQMLSAPLFLTCEILFALGRRQELKKKIESLAQPRPAAS